MALTSDACPFASVCPTRVPSRGAPEATGTQCARRRPEPRNGTSDPNLPEVPPGVEHPNKPVVDPEVEHPKHVPQPSGDEGSIACNAAKASYTHHATQCEENAIKQWRRSEAETFRFTRAQWGECSNFGSISGGMRPADLARITSETLCQTLKGLDPEMQNRIARIRGPQVAKQIGRSIALRADWEDVKIEAPRSGCGGRGGQRA